MIEETVLIELGGDSDDIVGVSANLWNRVEKVQICVLFVDQGGDQWGVRVVFRASFFVDATFYVVVVAALDELPVEVA